MEETPAVTPLALTPTPSNPNGLYPRDPTSPAVLVADGFGISLTVSRGHLVVADGLGRHRRVRKLARAQRTTRRIIVLGHTGHVSLEAVRWCNDTGVAVVQMESDGTVLLSSGPNGTDDPRLRRSQAAAPSSQVGVAIARQLLAAKVEGQASVLEDLPDLLVAVTRLRAIADDLRTATDLVTIRKLVAQASNLYFGVWSTSVGCRFTTRDAHRVSQLWAVFTARTSPLRRGGHSPRTAADPINAMLNYGYALAEAEARIACQAMGLDPGLGIVHTDKAHRDSLALDLTEPLRPLVERYVLHLLQRRHFRYDDFYETPQGACRLLPAMTHQLVELSPACATAVAPIAESVTHALAKSSPGKIRLTTPLSRQRAADAQVLGQRSSRRRPPVFRPSGMPTCRDCGIELTDQHRQLCPSCWPITRGAIAAARVTAGQQALASMRATGHDPTNTPGAAAKRSRALSDRKREELAWVPPTDDDWTVERFTIEVLPHLQKVPLSALRGATGLSLSACSRIRSGKLLPHQRHWPTLHGLSDG